MDHHYVVSFDSTILGVYGCALRELAFEKAAAHREKGIACEVFTQGGERQSSGAKYATRLDSRYAVAKEYCGYVTARWVARFCGEWLGEFKSERAAKAACHSHNDQRCATYSKKC